MRAFAILTMFLAWMLYGAMPALGSCPMGDQAMMATPAAVAVVSMAEMPMMTAAQTDATHLRHATKTACPDGMAHILFCAFCLVIPPVLAIDEARPALPFYPASALVRALQDARPAPLAPPPRLA